MEQIAIFVVQMIFAGDIEHLKCQFLSECFLLCL